MIKELFDRKAKSNAITLWKDKSTGKLRWLAAYSSNYLDDDYPSDIISKEAHLDFIEKVQVTKELPYPELRMWHLDGTAFGSSDYLFYDDENGIAMASGFIYDGMERVAKNISKFPTELGTSHGMTFVERDEKNQKVINKYVTIEISVLPLVAAANKMTSFYMLDKENNMMSTEQRDFLKNSGMSDEDILQVESRNKQAAEDNSLRERKSVDEPTPEVTEELPVAEPEVVEDKGAEVEVVPESAPEVVSEDDLPVTAGQLKATVEYLTQTVMEQIGELRKSIEDATAKSTELEKAINEKTLTPGANLSQIVGKSLIDKSVSRPSGESKPLEKSDPLYSDTPTEAPIPESQAGISFRSIIKNITGEKTN